jgi:hypothetical protein
MQRKPRPRPTRSASGLIQFLGYMGWSGKSAADRLGISHPTLIGLRDGTQRPGQVVMDTVMDSLQAQGFNPRLDTLFPRTDKPQQEDDREPVSTAAG